MKFNKSPLIAALSLLAVSGLIAKENPKKDNVPGVAPQPAEFFYTGKPYDADLGAYTFNYRNYDPELKRWTCADPSGFPDGANNRIYAPNPCSQLDRLGLMTIYQDAGSTDVSMYNRSSLVDGSAFLGTTGLGGGADTKDTFTSEWVSGGGVLASLTSGHMSASFPIRHLAQQHGLLQQHLPL